eukprot:1146218-Pelagomonas_calceolata.AAC.12
MDACARLRLLGMDGCTAMPVHRMKSCMGGCFCECMLKCILCMHREVYGKRCTHTVSHSTSRAAGAALSVTNKDLGQFYEGAMER